MNLTTTPFDIKSLRKKLHIISFEEKGITINFLSPINSEINTGHKYMFGTYKDGGFFWFFNGKSIANSRSQMRDIYTEISNLLEDKNQTIFTFKGNLYGSRI